jgi:hypothetical protein
MTVRNTSGGRTYNSEPSPKVMASLIRSSDCIRGVTETEPARCHRRDEGPQRTSSPPFALRKSQVASTTWISPDGIIMPSLCRDGTPRIVLAHGSAGIAPKLALELSLEVCTKNIRQVEAGRSYRNLKRVVNGQIDRNMREECGLKQLC